MFTSVAVYRSQSNYTVFPLATSLPSRTSAISYPILFGSFLGTAGQEMFQFGETDELELNSYKVLFEKMRKNSRVYPNYIFALTMGTSESTS